MQMVAFSIRLSVEYECQMSHVTVDSVQWLIFGRSSFPLMREVELYSRMPHGTSS